MDEIKYLYGAAVQGIQSFIFQTNELKDIVGASELVEQICTTAFDEFATDGESILRAAGNIKYIFTNKKHCENAVREFPKKVMEMAPGITISQAVVIYEELEYNESLSKYVEKQINNRETKVFQSFANAVDELESRLRTQRNKPMNSVTIGLMGMLRSRKTGLPVVFHEEKKDEYMDAATYEKRYELVTKEKLRRKRTTKRLCEKSFNIKFISDQQIAYDIEEITTKNDWIAIIHADGNGLGQIVQKIGKDKDIFKEFSQKLDKATIESANKAFEFVKTEFKINDEDKIPIRPIVLGGDDLTVIIRGDMAVSYVTEFMRQFEQKTKDYLGKIITDNKVFEGGADRLTACAGIAFIKSSFPFYYGYDLAEALCSEAKKDAKLDEHTKANNGLAPSCLMFHKVQDSFVEDYGEIVKRELTPCPNYTFKYGPYYINELTGRWTIEKLQNNVKCLDGKEGNAVKSHLRQWMSLMHNDKEAASQKAFRIIEILSNTKLKEMVLHVTGGNEKSPVYDMLALSSIINQETKNQEDK